MLTEKYISLRTSYTVNTVYLWLKSNFSDLGTLQKDDFKQQVDVEIKQNKIASSKTEDPPVG